MALAGCRLRPRSSRNTACSKQKHTHKQQELQFQEWHKKILKDKQQQWNNKSTEQHEQLKSIYENILRQKNEENEKHLLHLTNEIMLKQQHIKQAEYYQKMTDKYLQKYNRLKTRWQKRIKNIIHKKNENLMILEKDCVGLDIPLI